MNTEKFERFRRDFPGEFGKGFPWRIWSFVYISKDLVGILRISYNDENFFRNEEIVLYGRDNNPGNPYKIF